MVLNEKEIIIIRELLKANRPLTIYRLSKRSPYSWITINKYTKVLIEKNILKYTTKTKRKTKVFLTEQIQNELNSQNKTKPKGKHLNS